ncbi:MAG: hypothetical protein JSW00_16240 [Thermoplasmata archaeon]|nr:MAG: hypothetical protein JSW00_16240 [Thermoplasmata archaeon]
MTQKKILSLNGLLLLSKEVFMKMGIYDFVSAKSDRIVSIENRLMCLYHFKKFKPKEKFEFQGRKYDYFWSERNFACITERAVEIPIIWELVKQYKDKRILEVGNVLWHYFPVDHDVVDKYEKAEGVINEDVVDFNPSEKYDLIVSISTLEHVGWDETPKEPKKILRAVDNLKECLAPKGKMVVTLPLGVNTEMDRLLAKDKIPFTKRYFLKRISSENRWKETTWDEVSNSKFGDPFHCANALVIGIIES